MRTRRSEAETSPRVRGKLKSSLTNRVQIRLAGALSGRVARKEIAQKHVTKTRFTGTKLGTTGWVQMLSLNRSYSETFSDKEVLYHVV